jgi:hypothetical protein
MNTGQLKSFLLAHLGAADCENCYSWLDTPAIEVDIFLFPFRPEMVKTDRSSSSRVNVDRIADGVFEMEGKVAENDVLAPKSAKHYKTNSDGDGS